MLTSRKMALDFPVSEGGAFWCHAFLESFFSSSRTSLPILRLFAPDLKSLRFNTRVPTRTTPSSILEAQSMISARPMCSRQGDGINDLQQVAGVFVKKGALFSAGSTTNIPTLGGSYGEATAINNSGVMTGYAALLNDGACHAFSYVSTDGTIVELGTLGGILSRGDGINKSGQIVGEAVSSIDGRYHAFLRTQGVMYDINNLALDNMPGFYQLTEANAINDKGWITGSGITANFSYIHAFLAISQPVSKRIKGITKVGNSVSVTIDSTTSFNYQLQAAPGLTSQFANLGDPQAGVSGQVLTFPNPSASATAGFYLIVIGQ